MRSWSTIVAILPLYPVLFQVQAQDQQGSGSPYSAYGFGTQSSSTQVAQGLMGLSGVALYDPFSVVRVNPATYASLGRPVFETGAGYRFVRFSDERQQASGSRFDLLGFSLGIPFGGKAWGLALGLNPVSQVGYTLKDSRPLDDGQGKAELVYTGTGGLSRAWAGLAHRVWLRSDTARTPMSLDLGVNFEFVFGNVESSRKAYYTAGQGYYDNAVVGNLVVNAPLVNTGMQYTAQVYAGAKRENDLKARIREAQRRDSAHAANWVAAGKDPTARQVRRIPRMRDLDAWRVRVGAAVESGYELAARAEEFAYLFLLGGRGLETILDTVRFVQGTRGGIQVPVRLAAGVSVYDARWTFSAEYSHRDWTQLTTDLEGLRLRDQLGMASTLAFGASLKPAGRSSGGFHRTVTYRAGVRHTSDYLVVDGRGLEEIGMAFGISAPLFNRQTRSRFNIGMELGEYGTTENSLVRQRFANVMFGITITPDLREPWMQKRRID
jgi:hypothetical protein